MDGIDVSHHQDTIDWGRVAAAGIAFAYIKVSEGARTTDTQAEANAAGARQAGVRRGGYHFARPVDVAEQVDLFAVQLRALDLSSPGSLIPALDMEDLTLRTSADAFVTEFRDRLREHGIPNLIVYGNLNWYTKILHPDPTDGVLGSGWADDHVRLWVARYRDDRSVGGLGWEHPRAAVYQWSNTGRVDGIAGDVDLDVLLPGWDLEGVTINDPVTPPHPPDQAPPSDGYVVREGDTLSGIAALWFGDGRRWPEIYAANRDVIGPDPDVIWEGQVLHLPIGGRARQRLYTVMPRNVLSTIALTELGDGSRWPEIYEMNRAVIGPDPNKIRPGQVLRLPSELGERGVVVVRRVGAWWLYAAEIVAFAGTVFLGYVGVGGVGVAFMLGLGHVIAVCAGITWACQRIGTRARANVTEVVDASTQAVGSIQAALAAGCPNCGPMMAEEAACARARETLNGGQG